LRPGSLADVSLSVEEPLGNVIVYTATMMH
jgi:hypothetical protein